MKIKHLIAILVGFCFLNSAPAVFAADLGGDCCADLEERVATLEATSARKGNRKVSLQIYGQVNQTLLFWDDGKDSDTYVVDNDSSSSRFGFQGEAKINKDWSAGYLIEIGVEATPSNKVSQDSDDGSDGNYLKLRRSEMYIKSKTLGKLKWGLTKHALEDIAKADLSGTNIVARNDGKRLIENFYIINSADGSKNEKWKKVLPGDFQLKKQNVIRYDTPSLAGFYLSASWGEDDEYSASIRYKGTHDEYKIDLRLGYGVDDDDDGEGNPKTKNISTSASILHMPTGLFLTGSWGRKEEDVSGKESETYQIKTGIKQKWNSLGSTAIYGEYLGSEVDGYGEADIWGFGVVQKVDAAAMELYAGFRHYEADLNTNVATEDFITVVTGARIKF